MAGLMHAIRSVFLLVILGVSVTATVSPIAIVSAQTSVDPNGYSHADVQSILATMNKIESGVDQLAATSLASATSSFQAYSLTSRLMFNSVFETFVFNRALSVNVTSVNVVYVITFPNGTAGNLVLKENPTLTQVLGVATQPSLGASGSTQYLANWAGYTMAGAAPGSMSFPAVYVADATWSVPAVTEASNNECHNTYCDLAVWPGITDALSGGDNHIVQAGSMSQIYCTASSCPSGGSTGSSYFTWYEFDTSGSSTLTQCATVSSGDTIDGAVDSAAYNGGSNTSWFANAIDTTNATGCGSGGNGVTQTYSSFSPGPQFGQWIVERASRSGSYTHLPEFSTVAFSSAYICYTTGSSCSTPFPGIYTPYSNGWYWPNVMCNPTSGCPPGTGTINVNEGAVSSSNTFTATWYSSTNA